PFQVSEVFAQKQLTSQFGVPRFAVKWLFTCQFSKGAPMEGQAHGLLSTPGVGFIGMLVIGILAGWIAEKITSSDHGLPTNLLVGIAGSFIGGTLAGLLNLEFYGWLGNLLVATIGAILVLWVWRTVASYRY